MYFPFTLFTDEICVTQSTKEPVNCAQLLSRNGLQSDLGADFVGFVQTPKSPRRHPIP